MRPGSRRLCAFGDGHNAKEGAYGLHPFTAKAGLDEKGAHLVSGVEADRQPQKPEAKAAEGHAPGPAAGEGGEEAAPGEATDTLEEGQRIAEIIEEADGQRDVEAALEGIAEEVELAKLAARSQ